MDIYDRIIHRYRLLAVSRLALGITTLATWLQLFHFADTS